MSRARATSSSTKHRKAFRPDSSGTETLNFKVTNEFKKEFKGYAVSQGLTMVDLLKDGFELSKRKRSQK